jgi:ferrochelatase
MFANDARVRRENQFAGKKYSVAFQSRLGRDPWLTPYTDKEIDRLAKSGVKKLLVICPAFVSDCLETIEEIGMRGRKTFLAAGGTELKLIPCLNEPPLWIEALQHKVAALLGNAALSASAISSRA